MLRWLQRNWRLKLGAFVLAVVTWLFVNGITSEREVVAAVPFEIKTKAGLTVIRQNPTKVDVTVRGTRDDVRRVSRESLLAVLDLSHDDETGEITRRLTPVMVQHPRWAQPVEVAPGFVTVWVEAVIEKELAVKPRIRGEPPAGFVIESVTLSPDRVQLRGLKSVLGNLDAIETLPIEVSRRTMSFRERVELTPLATGKETPERHWVEVDVRIHAR